MFLFLFDYVTRELNACDEHELMQRVGLLIPRVRSNAISEMKIYCQSKKLDFHENPWKFSVGSLR